MAAQPTSRSTNPDDASTTGSNATEERSEPPASGALDVGSACAAGTRESRVPRAFWTPQSISEYYRIGGRHVPTVCSARQRSSDRAERVETAGGSGVTIEVSDRPCVECEEPLDVISISELQQVVSGWSCPVCGYVEAEKHRFRATVPLLEEEASLIRKLKAITTEDVRDPLGNVEGEFSARATAEMDADEVWMLVDPDDEELVDVVCGADHREREESAE